MRNQLDPGPSCSGQTDFPLVNSEQQKRPLHGFMVYIALTWGAEDKKCSVNHIPSLNYDLQTEKVFVCELKSMISGRQDIGKNPRVF